MYLSEGDVIDDQTLAIQPSAIVELIVSREYIRGPKVNLHHTAK
jgi:hypothetical protein